MNHSIYLENVCVCVCGHMCNIREVHFPHLKLPVTYQNKVNLFWNSNFSDNRMRTLGGKDFYKLSQANMKLQAPAFFKTDFVLRAAQVNI